jgi:hypothetical protein
MTISEKEAKELYSRFRTILHEATVMELIKLAVLLKEAQKHKVKN